MGEELVQVCSALWGGEVEDLDWGYGCVAVACPVNTQRREVMLNQLGAEASVSTENLKREGL